MIQFKPSCRWSHIPMTSTLRLRQILPPFFSDNQDTRSIIHDATVLSSDLNKYLFVPCHTKCHWGLFCRNSFLWKLLYFHCKFTLRPWKLFAICRWNFPNNFCLGDNCTLIIYSPGGQNKMATENYLEHRVNYFFFYKYDCILIWLTLRMKQNFNYFVFWLNSHWGRNKNGQHFAYVVFNCCILMIWIRWNKMAIVLQMTFSK